VADATRGGPIPGSAIGPRLINAVGFDKAVQRPITTEIAAAHITCELAPRAADPGKRPNKKPGRSAGLF
jgi:hypothetical protein